MKNMRRKTKKRTRKKVLIVIGIAVAVLVTAAGYWNINRKLPPAVLEEAKIGEQLEFHDGVMISVDSDRFLTEEEQEQLYKETGTERRWASRVLEVNLVLENTTAEDRQVVLSDMYLEGTGIADGIPLDITSSSGGRYSSNQQELQPGEKKQISYPYVIIQNQISKKEWKHITEREFWLTFSSYPVKSKLLLS